ncbi:MAG: ROK family protein [Candidatus Omnitrophota bacterium]|nr:ROK family protein [Candidatus Omnitrophota bacterium]
MTRRQWAVGVDFGGTNIKCGLVDPRGRVRRSLVLPTKRFSGPAAFVDGVSAAVHDLTASLHFPVRRLAGVGIGVPGLVDAAQGKVHLLTNVPGWHDVPLASRLRSRLRVPVLVDNDVNLITLGEWRFGAGRGANALIGITLGTGVGGGIMLNGSLYRGASGVAGELGHMGMALDGPRCACGARGCLEAHVGTAAILRMARQAARTSRGPLYRVMRQARGRLTPELVARAARMGDTSARQVWAKVGRRLGHGLASVVNLLNPDRVVIGGGVANAWTWFAPSLQQALRAHAMTVPGRHVKVVRAKLGDQAGIVGAAVLVWGER